MDFETRPSLFSRLREGEDAASWREFEARYRELILRYCRSRGLQPSDADDVLQMVLIGFARALPGFRYDPAKGRFRGYLGRCVSHAIRRRARARPADLEQLAGELAAELEAPDEGQLDREWEAEWMDHHYRLAMQHVRTTFEAQSVEVFEHLLGGHSVEECAQRFALSTQAVHKIKQRIRDRLKQRIAEQLELEDGAHG